MKTIITRVLGAYLDMLAIISPSRAARKGFLLFCRPFRIPANQKQLSFFNSGDKFQLNHDSFVIQGYKWGSGPHKVLFLHGWQSHTYRWKAYIEALPKDRFTVYSLDAPGHGLSSGNFLSVPLYSSVIEQFIKHHNDVHTIVGHSLGGFSVLYTMFRKPVLPVDRIILLAPPGEASDFIAAFKRTLGVSDRTVKLVVDHFSKQYNVTPDYFSSLKFVEGLNVRGLIIHDEDDTEAPYRYSVPLKELWKNSRLVTTKGYGHNLKSATVVKEVVNFILEPVDASIDSASVK